MNVSFSPILLTLLFLSSRRPLLYRNQPIDYQRFLYERDVLHGRIKKRLLCFLVNVAKCFTTTFFERLQSEIKKLGHEYLAYIGNWY